MGTGVSCVKTTKVEPFVYHEEDSTSTTGSRIIKIIQSLHQIYILHTGYIEVFMQVKCGRNTETTFDIK